MKKFVSLLLTLCIICIGFAGCESKDDGTHTEFAAITIKDYGTIVAALYGKTAPKTVENFVALAKEGFYDGLTFHRIIEDFMMQGGDPNADGTGGSEKTVKGEFSQNGVNNTLSHTRGTLSMARSSDYNSASSQFFIVHKDSTFLDGQYAAFGRVVDGMDIVDKICTEASPIDGNGLIAPTAQPIIETIKISKEKPTITSKSDTSSAASSSEASSATVTDPVTAEIEIENYGTVTLSLTPEHAPITVSNFVKLADDGFYNGLTFHRIIEGFMMQGGDPNGNGTGGSNENIKGEFSQNGVNNTLSHTRGTISMARSSDYNSASSQFFIVHKDSTFLDGQYAAFGYVTDGMDIVDKICTEASPIDGNGLIASAAQPIIKEIRIIK